MKCASNRESKSLDVLALVLAPQFFDLSSRRAESPGLLLFADIKQELDDARARFPEHVLEAVDLLVALRPGGFRFDKLNPPSRPRPNPLASYNGYGRHTRITAVRGDFGLRCHLISRRSAGVVALKCYRKVPPLGRETPDP